MERIGIAASKIAKGNLLLYNFFVVLLSFLLATLIFLIAGSSIFLALVVINYVGYGQLPPSLSKEWNAVMLICMICLGIIVSLFTLLALLKNIRLTRNR